MFVHPNPKINCTLLNDKQLKDHLLLLSQVLEHKNVGSPLYQWATEHEYNWDHLTYMFLCHKNEYQLRFNRTYRSIKLLKPKIFLSHDPTPFPFNYQTDHVCKGTFTNRIKG